MGRKEDKQFKRDVLNQAKKLVLQRNHDRAVANQILDDKVFIQTAQANAEYLAFLENLDYSQWYGSTKLLGFMGLDTKGILNYIYRHGACAVYKHESGALDYAIPVPCRWGTMSEIIGVNLIHERPNGSLTSGKEYIVGSDCIILADTLAISYGNLPKGRGQLVKWCLSMMSDMLGRIKNNMVLSGDKVIFTTPDIEAIPEMERVLNEAYSAYKPWAILVDKLEKVTTQTLTQTDSKFSELFGGLKQLDIMRMSIHGLGTGAYGIDKKERLITDEAEAGNDTPEFTLCQRLDLWREQIIALRAFDDRLGMANVDIGGQLCYTL